MAPFFADAHADVAWACLADGRDFADEAPGKSLSLPAWRRGGVRLACGTVFAVDAKDPDGARGRAEAQLAFYDALCTRHPDAVARPTGRADLVELDGSGPIRLLHLMEGAEPVASPDEVPWWRARGVVAIGPVWNTANRWGAGTHTSGGLTADGRALVRAIGAAGCALDLSHMNPDVFRDALDAATGPVYASHSNAAALCPHRRNLADDQIREIGARGGIVGCVGYAPFVVPDATGPAPLDAFLAHVEHVAALLGRDRVCLGLDYDGGFGPDRAIAGIPTAAELPRLAEALVACGWADAEVRAACGTTLARFLAALLPA